MSTINAHKDKARGIATTIAYHVGLLLLALFFGYTAPWPPPPEEGLLVNFGTDAGGLGEVDPGMMDNNLGSAQASDVPPASESTDKEAYLTQDIEDAPVIQKKKTESVAEKPKIVTAKKNTAVSESVQEKKTESPTVRERTINSKALFPGNPGGPGNGDGSEGITQGQGNQGDPDGDPNSKNYGPGGGTGNGVSFSLSGRKPLNLVVPDNQQQKSGIVVVKIIVNKDGKVTHAAPGYKGSTTTDDYLLGVAEKAARASIFDRKADAAAEVEGTITYHFKLR